MIRRLLLVLSAVALLVVPTAASAGGCLPDPDLEPSSSSRRSVAIRECAFVDTVTYVDPGETVRWVNRDHAPHTVTGAAVSWGTEDLVDLGESVSYTFEEDGVYPYYCALHPSMVGAVVVGDGKGGAGAGGITKAGIAGPVNATAPGDTESGTSPAVLALAAAAGLAGVAIAARFLLGRRTTTAPAP